MKLNQMIEIVTNNYEEQQFILDRFPAVWWEVRSTNETRFYVPKSRESEVHAAINEYKERIK